MEKRYLYPAIEYLCNIDFSDKNIFEFGSGYSSLFWARRAKSLISVEHDEKWYKKIKAYCIKNQQILLKEVNNKYEETIIEQKIKYDVIIIDGIRRPQCSKIIKNYFNFQSIEGCMVILDNSDWYRETAKYLRENLDMIEVDFHGFGPINDYTWTTSVFVSRNFRFKSNNNVQPHFSISAIKQSGEG